MSNDSNERGHDTAAQAFQVGDRVRWHGANALHMTYGQQEGVVNAIKSGGWYRMTDSFGDDASVRSNDLTLIARARTTFSIGDRVLWDCRPGTGEPGYSVAGIVTSDTDSRGWLTIESDAGEELVVKASDCKPVSEPATPAPAPAQTARPTIVCLCGSTRFSAAFRDANLRETLEGRIVLSIGCDMRSDAEIFGGMPESELDEIKRRLDDLHKRKIDLADEILVLNVGGYIGESTHSEVAYAREQGKRIRYLEALDTEEPAPSEPATPAPETDAMVIEGEAREWCRECDNTGHLRYADGSTDPCRECDGTGHVWAPRTIRLSDEALDRLAGELAKRLARSVRLIRNTSGK